MKRHYVYRHIRLDTNEPFYIGIGSRIEREMYTGDTIRAKSKSHRSRFWKNIVSVTDYFIDILYESDCYDEIKKKEIEFIKLYGRKNLGLGPLVNLTDGGDGNLGWIPSEEWKNGLRNILIDGYKNKKRRKNNKKIYQYDLEGNFIKEWESKKEAAAFIGVFPSALAPKFTQRKGFQWRSEFLGDKIDSVDVGIIQNRNGIMMLDKDTEEIIKTFESIKEALEYLGKKSTFGSVLRRSCKDHFRVIYGYKWRYNNV